MPQVIAPGRLATTAIAGPPLSSLTWRTSHEHHCHFQSLALEQGKTSRAESPSPTQRYMGHPGKAPDCGENLGSCSIRLGHRQQAASLRLNQASCAGHSPWRTRVDTSHHDAAENSATSALRSQSKPVRLWRSGYIRPISVARIACFRAGCEAQIISPPGNTLESLKPG